MDIKLSKESEESLVRIKASFKDMDDACMRALKSVGTNIGPLLMDVGKAVAQDVVAKRLEARKRVKK